MNNAPHRLYEDSRITLSAIAITVAMTLVATWPRIVHAQGGGNASEPAFLKNLHITGFYQNTTGTWVNSSAIEYNKDRFGNLNRNSLAAERQLLQLDVNDDFTEKDSMFLRAWFAYEPPYPWEITCFGPGTIWSGFLKGQSGAKMDCNGDFYNVYGIRELWFKHRIGRLRLFVGRQIVTWGESIAFRVGDQINPRDLSWAFGFTDLEQSRIPLWMLHPVLNLPKLGPFSSNFAELVYIPGVDFLYNQVDYTDDHIDGLDNIAGRVSITGQSGGRFGGRPDGRSINISPAPGIVIPAAIAPPFVLLQARLPGPGPLKFVIGMPEWTIPGATWGNSQVGFRLHTLAANTELTAFYLWSHDEFSIARIENRTLLGPVPPGLFFRRISEFYPQYQAFGVTANRPIYLPGALAQLPLVIRTESLYKNHDAFNTTAIPGTVFEQFGGFGLRNFSPSGVTRSDSLTWLFALDLDSAYAPWLTSTGNLTVNLEVMDSLPLSFSHNMFSQGSFEKIHHNDMNMLVNVGTSWWWGAISPFWTAIYAPQGETFLLFPAIQLTPPWTEKYFMKLEWVGIFGTDRYNLDGGGFKGKDLFVAQFQYNFSLF